MRKTRFSTIAALWAFALAFCAANVRAQSHPHMLWTAGDVAPIISHEFDPFYTDTLNETKISCHSVYTGPTSATVPNRANEKAILCHGLLWLVDPTLAASAHYQSDVRFKSYFWTVLNYPGWSSCFNNDQLMTGCLLRGLTIGYDMHFDKFTPAERTMIVSKLSAIADYMLAHPTQMLEIPSNLNNGATGYQVVYKVLRNKFVIAFGGLGLIAYCLEGEVSETKRQTWLAELDACLAAWSAYASPDGVSLESYSYDEFMLRVLLPMLETRTRRTGVNQFELYPFVKNYPIYSIYSWIPGGDHSFALSLPYGDSDTEPASSMRGNAAYLALRLVTDGSRSNELANWEAYRAYQQPPNNSFMRDDPMHYIVAVPSIPVTSPDAMSLPRFHFFPNARVFVWRTGWDNMATYFSMQCSPQRGYHQQPETGNFMIYKGGNPFIAHHGYTNIRNTDDYNVMLIGGAGQWGDDNAALTSAQPASHWGDVDEFLADNDLFMVRTNLKGAYKSSAIVSYHRDYFGFGDCYFVRDQAKMTASTAFASHTHSYQVARKTENAGEPGYFDPNDINSALTNNPWSGSNGSYALAPHPTSLYAGSMQVRDLSATNWARSIAADIVNVPAQGSYSLGNRQRGYDLLRTATTSNMTSLMAYYFPAAGQTVASAAMSNGEGFAISQSGQPVAFGAWSNDGGDANGGSLAITGVMAGIHLQKDWIWGLDATKLAYLGKNLMTSDNPVTFFVHRQDGVPATIQTRNSSAATMHLYVGKPVAVVYLNGSPYANWNWSGNDLRLSLPASNGATFALQFGSAADLLNYP